MNKHKLFDYMNYAESLKPTADMLKEIANSEWWTVVSEHFDHLIYQHWFDRTVLFNMKFPYDPSDPDNTSNMDMTVNQILFAFTINLRVNARKYEKMYEVFKAEYNPLYNVDAWETEERKLDQTGTDTYEKSGNDTNTKSGSIDTEKAGKEATTRTGSESLSHTGSDTTVNQKTTYDNSSFFDTDKSTITPGVQDTTTYNNVKDETQFTGRKDTEKFNNVSDRMEYGSQNLNTRDLHDREFIEKRRYGNIGVTKSSELLLSSLEESEITGSFIYRVVHDCVNSCTYMVE